MLVIAAAFDLLRYYILPICVTRFDIEMGHDEFVMSYLSITYLWWQDEIFCNPRCWNFLSMITWFKTVFFCRWQVDYHRCSGRRDSVWLLPPLVRRNICCQRLPLFTFTLCTIYFEESGQAFYRLKFYPTAWCKYVKVIFTCTICCRNFTLFSMYCSILWLI